MRTFRLVLAAVAAASASGVAAPASADHCIQVDESVRPICALPRYCVMYPDGTIRCYD